MAAVRWATDPNDYRFGSHVCRMCETTFRRVRPDQKWCSKKCALKAYYTSGDDLVRRRVNPKTPEEKAAARLAGHLKRSYGMTVDEFQAMSDRQGGVCAICGGPPIDYHTRLTVDHVKDSNPVVVRGLLCSSCNTAIGLLGHNPANLMAAAAYLRRNTIN